MSVIMLVVRVFSVVTASEIICRENVLEVREKRWTKLTNLCKARYWYLRAGKRGKNAQWLQLVMLQVMDSSVRT